MIRCCVVGPVTSWLTCSCAASIHELWHAPVVAAAFFVASTTSSCCPGMLCCICSRPAGCASAACHGPCMLLATDIMLCSLLARACHQAASHFGWSPGTHPCPRGASSVLLPSKQLSGVALSTCCRCAVAAYVLLQQCVVPCPRTHPGVERLSLRDSFFWYQSRRRWCVPVPVQL